MRRSKVYDLRQPSDLTFNMTPMIDCTFQLIIFFLLAGSFASLDNLRLSAPEPTRSLAQDLKLQSKAVLNIPPFDAEALAGDPALAGRGRCWKIGKAELEVGDVEALAQELRLAQAAFERRRQADASLRETQFQVEVRADRTIDYRDVEAAMLAISRCGIKRMNITALEEGRGG